MGLSSWFLLLSLIVGAGILAYVGDRLGTKLGKARISLFGMRPRKTAGVITVITGMLIAAVSLIILSLVSENVRIALTQAESLRREKTQLVRDVSQLSLQVSEFQRRAENESERAAEATQRAKKTMAELDKTLSQRDALRKRMEALNSSLRRSAYLLAQRNRELAKIRLRVQLFREEVLATKNEAESVKLALAEKQASLESKQADLNAVLSQLVQKQKDLSRAEDGLKKAEDAIYKVAEQTLAAERNLSSLKRAKADLERQIEDYSRRVGLLEDTTAKVRDRSIIFSQGDELARVIVQGGRPVPVTAMELKNLMAEAEEAALAAGAKAESGSAVYLVTGSLQVREGGQIVRSLPLDYEEKLKLLAQTISSSPGSVVARVVPMYNTAIGEQVAVDIELFRNSRVYGANALVAKTQIRGHTSRGEILGAVMKFLEKDVREGAIRAGIIPRTRRGGGVGQVAFDEILAVVDQVKAMGTTVELTARAASDTNAGDDLRIDLGVR